jgi:hypothetical protein
MNRSIMRIGGEGQTFAVLTVASAILLGTSAAALQGRPGSSPTPPNPGDTVVVDLSPKNMLRFPSGVQRFDKRENIKLGESVTRLPGWTIDSGMIVATIDETPPAAVLPGAKPKRWLAVEDLGALAGQGITTPLLEAPEPWTYAWSFSLQIMGAPATEVDAPVLAVQHRSPSALKDAWGLRFKPDGAELFVTNVWGWPTERPLFAYTGETAIGEWIDIRIVADLRKNTLQAFVNGTATELIRTRPAPATDVTKLRLSYHGSGSGNVLSVRFDEIGVAFLNPLCIEDKTFDFTTEDDLATALVDGQKIDVGFEFGAEMTIASAGANAGAAIFDSSIGGGNDPSQDPDLLVDQGNILILQTDSPSNPPIVGDVYPNPNDDEDGGTFTFTFNRPLTPLSVDLIDIDLPNQDAVIVMTDFSNLTRTYTVPSDWTGDITLFQPGVGTLDLQDTNPQAGFNSVATAAEDLGFDPNAVTSMTVTLSGSGALDNLHVVIPCVQITFDTEDDFTPVFSGTPLANGQDLSTPPEFGVEMALTSAGPNSGAAIFDSTLGGPNDPGPDNDLLVGLGNILILQNNLFATQSVAGIFDTPNDDTNGGDLFFAFPGPVHVHQMTLIDVDEEEVTGVTVTLMDSGGDTRVFDVPPAWTKDRLNDGDPGFGLLDLDSLAPQPGFAAIATAMQDPGFDPDDVVLMTVTFGGAQAMDNICFCP